MMLFNIKTATSLLSLSSIASTAALQQKRDALATAIYAYGTEINGLDVIYIDKLAYIGSTVPDTASVASNITFATDNSDTTVPWQITSNSSSITGASLYIIPTAGSSAQAGFIASNDTTPTGAVTTGFLWFGTQVAYTSSDNQLEMQFWAVATNTTGLWSLVWNSDGSNIEGATPVALKSTPPLTLDDVVED